MSEKDLERGGDVASTEPLGPSPGQPSASDEAESKPENLLTTVQTPVPPPYTVFTRSEKIVLVLLASLAAFFSPVTANIYYPAINELAVDLRVSTSLINLTITTYLIFQGLAPTFVGAIADSTGRRPAYIVCFVLYLAANIGLALQSDYSGLMVLRCLQSSGSSGTVALVNAVVADISTSSQRGRYLGFANVGALLGPTIGPIIGGVLNQFLGWRSIFWFLVILSGVVFVAVLVLLPETCRKVVGNGSTPPPVWNMSLMQYLKLRKERKKGTLPSELPSRKFKAPNLLASIQIIFTKAGSIALFYCAVIFAGFYTIAAGLPIVLQKNFNYNSLQIGLCYIPFGFGGMVSSFTVGRAVDWNFRRHAQRLNIPITKGRQSDLSNFPVELARLQVALPFTVVSICSLLIYAWVVEKTKSLAGILILLLIMGCTTLGPTLCFSTLVVDLFPENPGSATAANNLLRCWFGAGFVAAVGPLADVIGMGWFYTLIAAIWTISTPLIWVLCRYGPRWREEKRVKAKLEEAERAEKEVGNVEIGAGSGSKAKE
ncbi:major facilitator superfamily domain-containing protein [Xylogone sp. PMI_703]|nr:major facilitator superfamily domain-containing protein [Xylogone sp. PMI_703]